MGSSQRVAAVAAVSHAKHHYNHTQTNVTQIEAVHYNVNIFFISVTLCGVLVAVCAACWRRVPMDDKPDEPAPSRSVYTVSADTTLAQIAEGLPEAGPPPAYDTLVETTLMPKLPNELQEIITEPCLLCQATPRCDSGLPTYEAAVALKDTKL